MMAAEGIREDFVGDDSQQLITRPAGEIVAQRDPDLDIQITTAKTYPRSIKEFRREATEMVTLDEDIASECMYALKRSGKHIEGPSARFAEVAASAWQNCRLGARIVDEDDRFVTAQGVFFDMQRNVSISYETKRRITDRHGKRYKDDMIGVTANAACSIALRNAVLKGIPKAFWRDIYAQARRTAIGDVKTLSSRRQMVLDHFAKMGVTNEQVFGKLEVKGVEDITLDDIALMKGLATSIRDGETTIENEFLEDAADTSGSKVAKSKLDPESAQAKKPDDTQQAASKAAEPDPGVSEIRVNDYMDVINFETRINSLQVDLTQKVNSDTTLTESHRLDVVGAIRERINFLREEQEAAETKASEGGASTLFN